MTTNTHRMTNDTTHRMKSHGARRFGAIVASSLPYARTVTKVEALESRLCESTPNKLVQKTRSPVSTSSNWSLSSLSDSGLDWSLCATREPQPSKPTASRPIKVAVQPTKNTAPATNWSICAAPTKNTNPATNWSICAAQQLPAQTTPAPATNWSIRAAQQLPVPAKKASPLTFSLFATSQ